jgi:hypothetical protein
MWQLYKHLQAISKGVEGTTDHGKVAPLDNDFFS